MAIGNWNVRSVVRLLSLLFFTSMILNDLSKTGRISSILVEQPDLDNLVKAWLDSSSSTTTNNATTTTAHVEQQLLAPGVVSSSSISHLRTATSTTSLPPSNATATTTTTKTENQVNLYPMIHVFRNCSPTVSMLTNVETVEPFYNASGPLPPCKHPHAGAKFANGTWGYVADITAVRLAFLRRYRTETTTGDDDDDDTRMPPLSYLPFDTDPTNSTVCRTPLTKGFEGEHGMKALDRVQIDSAEPQATNSSSSSSSSSQSIPDKRNILCAIYTHGGAHSRLPGIRNTWGWKCDGFFAASTESIPDEANQEGFGAVHLGHRGEESYDNMWQKTRSILGYIYDNYHRDYDYFFLCGDDTLLIVENLRRYLGELEAKGQAKDDEPLYLGSAMWNEVVYAGGGSGYVLNRAALKMLVEDRLLKCLPFAVMAWEDRSLGRCMEQAGVKLTDDTDATGRIRFHGISPDWIGNSKRTRPDLTYWQQLHNGNDKKGADVVSSQSVSFHLMKKTETMMRIHAILYKSCPAGTILGDALAARHQQENQKQVVVAE